MVSDNREGASRATAHLVRRGHRRVAFLGDLRTIWTAGERLAGYREGLSATGLVADPTLERLDLRDSDAAERAVIELLSGTDPPTAVFAGQNLLTIGALRGLGLERSVAWLGSMTSS